MTVSVDPSAINCLYDRYQTVRQATLALFDPLAIEDTVVQPIVDVSPPKWHLAHTTWFFETFLAKQFLPSYQEFHPQYGYLFNSYYESVGDRTQRNQRGLMTRPTVAEILAYRDWVDKALWQLGQRLGAGQIPDSARSQLGDLWELGLQHEQQHQELLLTDLKYILGLSPLFPVYRQDLSVVRSIAPQPMQFLPMGPGLYNVGYQEETGFCFDNERGCHSVYLAPFEIADRLVTNGEYLEFIADGGYQTFSPWLSSGWDWVNAHHIVAPLHWHKMDGEWHEFTLGGLRALDRHAPVTHVSYYEADAFARWAGARLPTEFEWEVACAELSPTVPKTANFLDTGFLHPIGPQAPPPPGHGSAAHGSATQDSGQPAEIALTSKPVSAESSRPTAGAIDPESCQPDRQFFGNVWQWTASAYLPYPGFHTTPGAVGEYNGKFMSDQWVLRGGSCATFASHIRPTYRNFFQADKQWQFSGFRLAR